MNIYLSFIFFFFWFHRNDTPPCDGNKIAALGLSETWWMRTEIVLWGPQRRWSQTAFLSSSINDNGPFYTNVPNTARRVTRITNVWERIVTIVNACIIVFDGTTFFFPICWAMELQTLCWSGKNKRSRESWACTCLFGHKAPIKIGNN